MQPLQLSIAAQLSIVLLQYLPREGSSTTTSKNNKVHPNGQPKSGKCFPSSTQNRFCCAHTKWDGSRRGEGEGRRVLGHLSHSLLWSFSIWFQPPADHRNGHSSNSIQQSARLPAQLPAWLPTWLPAWLPARLPAWLPTCLPGGQAIGTLVIRTFLILFVENTPVHIEQLRLRLQLLQLQFQLQVRRKGLGGRGRV